MLRMYTYLTPGVWRPHFRFPNNLLALKCRVHEYNYLQSVNLHPTSYAKLQLAYHLYTPRLIHYSAFNKSNIDKIYNNGYNNLSTVYCRQFSTKKPSKCSIIIKVIGTIIKFPFKLCKWTIQIILKPFKISINLTTGLFKLFGKFIRLIGSGINRSLRVARAARQSGVVSLTRSVWNGIVHTVHWCKTGFKLYAVNVRVSYFIMLKKFKGHQLGYKEHKLLMRTLNDCFKLVPFSFFLIVPFAEFLLPVAIKLFPNMLPSTFKQTNSDTSYLHKKLLVKKQLAEFFQELVQNHTNNLLQAELDSSIRTKAEALSAFQQRLMNKDDRDMNPFLTANELVVFSKLLKQEFVLDKMNLETLQVMCKLLGIRPFSLHSHVVLQLRHHLLKIQREDQMIRWEGVESLTVDELSEACRDRAMKFYDITKEQMQQNLIMWLDLSGRKDIPLILLLWSRCITMTHSPMEVKVDVITPDIQKEDEPHCKEEGEFLLYNIICINQSRIISLVI